MKAKKNKRERSEQMKEVSAGLQDVLGMTQWRKEHPQATWAEIEAAVAACEAETERLQQELPEAPTGACKQLMSADGAFVPLVGGVWMEVKTLVMGTVTHNKKGEICSEDLSSFSRLCKAEQFEEAT